jgi:hypothetical protein
LAEPHWIHEDEACFTSWNGNQQSGNRVLQDAQPISAALGGSVFHLFESRRGDWGTGAVLYNRRSVGRVADYLAGTPVADIDAMLTRAGTRLRHFFCVPSARSGRAFKHARLPSDIPKTLAKG